jgi:predicted Zn finger-like uncharacterized protein
MATPLAISCPACKKQYQVPVEAAGKKVRCKACGQSFVVPSGADNVVHAAPAAPAKTAPAKRAGLAAKKTYDTQEEEKVDLDPYDVTESDVKARCPHCAKELSEEHAVVCIHCGYDIRIRSQRQTKRTLETTFQDRVQWMMPGVLCLITAVVFAGIILFLWFGLTPLIQGRYKSAWFSFVDAKMWKVWGSVFCGFGAFFTGRFAFERLILHPNPPEEEVI